MAKRRRHTLHYFTSSLGIVIGLVLVWRGIWHTLDLVDTALFGGNHIITSLGGIILGLLVLYIPDKNLTELRKL